MSSAHLQPQDCFSYTNHKEGEFMKQSQDKLGQMPVGKLLFSMSVPMMISMFIQALYNMVDSIFVAKLNEDALTAVSLAFPLQNIMIAIAVGTGVGINALVSRCLGEGNIRRAEKAVNVQVFLDLVYTVLAVLLGVFFSRTYFTMQTDVQSIVDYGEQYTKIVCICSIGLFMAQGFEKVLIATGNSTPSMIAQASGAITNIILDPVFIFGLGPIPAMGVRGAAIATVIGQVVAAVIAFLFCVKRVSVTKLHISQMLPDLKILKFIYSVGIPSMLTIGLTAVMSYCMNNIFLTFSTTAAAVYGIWLKLQSFGFMPVFGMNNGTIAIYSYNFGAKKIDRVFRTMKLSMVIAVVLGVLVTLLYELLPIPLLKLFSASDFMMSIGVNAVRICAVSITFGSVCVIISSACQSFGRARYTLFINICRQVVFQVASAWVLARFGRLELVWFAPLIAEVLTMLISLLLCKRVIALLNSVKAEKPAAE